LFAAGACHFPRAKGPPARIVAGVRDTVVVNHYEEPGLIPVKVLDAAGRELSDTGVRFRWTGGMEVPVSPDGMVSCPAVGDATARASLGAVVTDLVLRCRPVTIVGISGPMHFVLGDSARNLPIVAIGPDGKPADLLAVTVIKETADTSVLALDGIRVIPRAPGTRLVDVGIGGKWGSAGVQVYEPVTTPEGLDRERRHLALRVSLRPGEERRWRIAAAPWMVWVLPYEYEERGLRVRMEGANCDPGGKPRSGGFAHPVRLHCLSGDGAEVVASHPSSDPSAPPVEGTVLLRRVDWTPSQRVHRHAAVQPPAYK
jgi:hypothetical protein